MGANVRTEQTVTLTTEELIEALKPAIARKLRARGARGTEFDLVETRWTWNDSPKKHSRPLPPGYSPISMSVMFTVARAAEREPS